MGVKQQTLIPYKGGSVSYLAQMLSLLSGTLIGYWPVSEGSGSTLGNAEGTAARDGSIVSVALGLTGIGDGLTAGGWDGINDYGDVYSLSLSGALDMAEGTVAVWAQVSGAGVWTDGSWRSLVTLRVDGSNEIRLQKMNTNNTLRGYRTGQGVQRAVTKTTSTAAWFHLALTWSKAENEVALYYNGAVVGAPVAYGLDAVGSLSATETVIGARNTTPTLVWSGNMAHVLVCDTPVSADTMATIATVV